MKHVIPQPQFEHSIRQAVMADLARRTSRMGGSIILGPSDFTCWIDNGFKMLANPEGGNPPLRYDRSAPFSDSDMRAYWTYFYNELQESNPGSPRHQILTVVVAAVTDVMRQAYKMEPVVPERAKDSDAANHYQKRIANKKPNAKLLKCATPRDEVDNTLYRGYRNLCNGLPAAVTNNARTEIVAQMEEHAKSGQPAAENKSRPFSMDGCEYHAVLKPHGIDYALLIHKDDADGLKKSLHERAKALRANAPATHPAVTSGCNR